MITFVGKDVYGVPNGGDLAKRNLPSENAQLEGMSGFRRTALPASRPLGGLPVKSVKTDGPAHIGVHGGLCRAQDQAQYPK